MVKKVKNATTSPILFDAIQSRRFGRFTCFLCGKRLSAKNRADEHIIPKWVQNRYDLWNQRLVLLNKTTIPYRQLTIPCCADCNTLHLQPIETVISDATAQGHQAVLALDPQLVFLWLGKIFYGLLYKELLLPWNRASSKNSTIIDRELLKQFQTHHLFLQSVRLPMRFENFFPASIFVFETQLPDNPQYQWDFTDSLLNMFIACRLGNVGIIATLQDGGAQANSSEMLSEFKQLALHPLQFRELCAVISYRASIFNRVPKYVMIQAENAESLIQVIQNPLAGFSRKPLFDDWDAQAFAHILSKYTGHPIDMIFKPPDETMTWLRNDDGSLRSLDYSVFPWLPSGLS